MTDPASPRPPGRVEAALDGSFSRLASRLGAVRADPPYEIAREFLERVGFFASFPRRAVSAGQSGSILPPATCYRLFQALASTDLAAPLSVTLTGPCFRREARYDAGRLRAFTMREIVVVADEDHAAAMRDSAAAASVRLARRLGLDAELEEATDPFFTDEARAKRILQRLLRLKLELLAPVAGQRLAIASFNLHQDFFGSRLAITIGGATAWSACAAWGIERWRLAVEERWGAEPDLWPDALRASFGLVP